MHRDNIFAGYVSLKRAEKTRLWHPVKAPANYQKTAHLTLDSKAVHRHIVVYKAYQDQGRDIVKDKAHLAVTYEDFQADAQGTLSRIVDFAGGQEQQVDWPLFKGGRANNESTVIDNLDEVALLGVEWMMAPFRLTAPQS